MGRRATWIALALLLTATAAAYLPSIDGDFVLDDQQLLADPLVAAPLDAGLSTWLAAPRPVLTATFALNHAAVGLDTRGWHLTNLAIHLAGVLLAWRLARRLLQRAGLADPEGPALAAAGLFALHPLQTEAVSYVTQRGESLASALYLAALLLLLLRDEARDEAPAARRAALVAGAAALLLLGLLVKPIVATLPAAWLLAAALLPPPREAAATPWSRARARLPAAAPLLALGLLSALWGLAATAGSNHAGFGMPDVPAATSLATQAKVIPIYLARLAVPVHQCADCFVPWSLGLADPAALAGAVLLAAALGGGLWLAVRARPAAGPGGGDVAAAARLTGFGFAFFLLVLAPSSLVPLRDPMAEHRVYLASLGLFAAGAAAAAVALRRWLPAAPRLAGAGLAAVLLLAAAGATARRNRTWVNTLEFHEAAAAGAPEKARVHHNLGAAQMGAQRFDDAVESFRRAQALEEDRTVSPRLIFENLMGALLSAGRVGEARAEVLDVLRTEGEDPWALALLAKVELVANDLPAAEAAARRALAVEPANDLAARMLAQLLLLRRDFAGAVAVLRPAAASGTRDPVVFMFLGEAEGRLGNREAACRALAHAAGLPTSKAQLQRVREALARFGCT